MYLILKVYHTKELGKVKADLSLAANQLEMERKSGKERLESQQRYFEERLKQEQVTAENNINMLKASAQELSLIHI